MSRCRMCGREYTTGGVLGGFCCQGCEATWNETAAGKSEAERTANDQKSFFLLLTMPFWLPWKCGKLLFKICKPLCKYVLKPLGRLTWKVCMNKWCWTIFTGGFAWLGYKLLKYVYEKEH